LQLVPFSLGHRLFKAHGAIPWISLPMEATMCPTEAATDRFIHAENLVLLGKRLADTTDIEKRQQILVLLREEKAKDHPPPKN
jgi:hypothetical protein